MNDDNRDPLLLTPGPLTTSAETKQAMLHDWGSRDQSFIDATQNVRDALVDVSGGGDAFTAVPVQGSGTFAVEAMVGTFLPKNRKLLIIVNGAYGHRIAKICDYIARRYGLGDAGGHAARCRCHLADACGRPRYQSCRRNSLRDDIRHPESGRRHCGGRCRREPPLVDRCHECLRGDPLNLLRISCDAVAASSNKCFEGVPGMGFVLCRKASLEETKGNAHSLSLDLFDQWQAMEANGQWRFTPPTHVVFAFEAALKAHAREGGVDGRFARYSENCSILVEGMKAFGFEPLLSHNLQSPIIVTFKMPSDPKFVFQTFYDRLKDRGYVIYPGKLTVAESFRMGCIGHLDADNMCGALAAVEQTLTDMGVTSGAP